MTTLVVTSKVAGFGDDDGGGTTSREVITGLAASGEEVRLLLTRAPDVALEAWARSQPGLTDVIWAAPTSRATPLLAAFLDEASRTADRVAELVAAGTIDTVVLVHVTHGLFLPGRLPAGVRLVVLPMFTSTSYARCGEPVPPEYRRREAQALATADLVITPSRYERGIVVAAGADPSRVTVVTRPLPQGWPTPRPPRSAPDATAVLVVVGAIRPQKGIDIAVEALAALRADGTPARLVVVGPTEDPALARGLRRLAEDRDVADHVTWADHLDHRGVADALTGADVALVPSHEETYGRAAMEGLALGVPTLVFSDLDAVLEVADGSPHLSVVERPAGGAREQGAALARATASLLLRRGVPAIEGVRPEPGDRRRRPDAVAVLTGGAG